MEWWCWLLTLGFILLPVMLCVVSCCRAKDSVLVVQVGLSSKARSIQRSLNQIAVTAPMSATDEITSSLLRHPTYRISGYTSVDLYGCESWADAKKHFNKLSLEEREKFDVENPVNVNNIKVQRTDVPNENKLGKEYIVLTILVAADRALALPVITDRQSLKEALLYLTSVHMVRSRIKAVHLLWSPQNESDAFTEEELHVNYPLLMDLSVQKGEAARDSS